VEEERPVSGVFGVDVDLSRDDRGAHDVGRAELQLVVDREAIRFEQVHDHIAEQCPLGVDLRGDDDPALGRADDPGRSAKPAPSSTPSNLGRNPLIYVFASFCRDYSAPPIGACRTPVQGATSLSSGRNRRKDRFPT